MGRARYILGAVLLAMSISQAPSAHAAGPSQAQVQAARELFQEAERDEDGKRWSEALEKLRRVAAVKLTPGVRYHMALCEENLGQLVAALGDYTLAENQARAENAPDVLRLVGEKLKGLKLRVPRLTIVVPGDVPDVEVRLDGEPILKAMWGVQIPLDPGEHKIEAKAPGRVPMARTIAMQERDSTLLEVKLAEVTKTPPAPPATTAPSSTAGAPPSATPAAAGDTTTKPTASGGHAGAIVTTLAAALLAGGGVVAFVVAGSVHDANVDACATQRSSCDSRKDEVRIWDSVALGAWIGAAALATVAVVLWASPSRVTNAPTRGELYVGPGALGLKGSF